MGSGADELEPVQRASAEYLRKDSRIVDLLLLVLIWDANPHNKISKMNIDQCLAGCGTDQLQPVKGAGKRGHIWVDGGLTAASALAVGTLHAPVLHVTRSHC